MPDWAAHQRRPRGEEGAKQQIAAAQGLASLGVFFPDGSRGLGRHEVRGVFFCNVCMIFLVVSMSERSIEPSLGRGRGCSC